MGGEVNPMSEQRELMPAGLSRKQFAALTEHAERAAKMDLETLRRRVNSHLEETQRAHHRNRLVNVRLASAICDSISHAFDRWDELSGDARNWLGGAILYFADCNDDDPDFSSALGFEDDAELLNACLKHAGMTVQCLAVEDFDDA